MTLFRKLSQRRRSATNNRRSSNSGTSSPPPSPPPGPPNRGLVVDNTQQSFSQIPLVYCDEEPCATASALPHPNSNNNVAVGVVPPVATVCEVLGPDNTDAMSYADSYAVSTTVPAADDSLAYSHATTAMTTSGPIGVGGGYATGYGYNNNNSHGIRSVSVGSYTTTPPTPPSPYGGNYNNARSTSGGYMMNAPPPPAPYGTPPSQIHVPHYSGNATIDTSPTSVRSAYTTGTSYVPGPPGPVPYGSSGSSYVGGGRRAISEAALRESAETTQSMTTSNGVQLQQLSMVNMQGRRLTPYVTKPRANTVGGSSARRPAYSSSSATMTTTATSSTTR